jgi:mannose-6-phosphate isomerase-like protein (cupin superfamily)
VHAASDQWVYVVSGRGIATVDGRRVALDPGALLLIEAGETHEIATAGEGILVTVNVYAPAAY